MARKKFGDAVRRYGQVRSVRWMPVFLIACGIPRSPVAPNSGDDPAGSAASKPSAPATVVAQGGPAGSEPQHADESEPSAPSPAVDAGPRDAVRATSCREGYYGSERVSELFPKTFHPRATEGRVCDLKERIVIVDDKTVTVLVRPQLKKTRAPIARREKLDDRCGGPGGGHAGCSITFQRFWSSALGAGYVEFGNNVGNLVAEDAELSKAEGCREDSTYAVVATCSTAKHFVLVKYQSPAYGEPPCWHLQASLWEGPAEQSTEIDGDIDRAASVGNHLVLRFPAAGVADRAITLGFDGRAGTATLDVGGEREACVAFRVSPYP